MGTHNKNLYAECADIERTKPIIEADEEIAKSIGENYRTIPTFEKGLFDNVYTTHYSLETNQLLKCRWRMYKKHYEKRVFAPFQFPNVRDLHFHNGSIQYNQKLSIFRHKEHRMKLKPGPGVDLRGQMPIPQELLMKRGHPSYGNVGKNSKKQINKK